ncbi:MAG TPA: PEP-CTERM sorting domain-containing protein, partial [Anaerohalosphaeraceae bacterium]|nr:PEP-CTERM sorting domain-containing protein [Anaerohalosphaeraceae bacterium]
GQIHYWNAPNSWGGNGYNVMDTTTGTITNMGKPASVNTNGFGDPFGVYDSQNNCFYAASYNTAWQSCLYKYSYENSIWSEEGTAVNMYGGATYNGNLYISGLRSPWSGGYDNTFISLYDFSPLHAHDALIEVGGASAHVTLDGQGNVYYATYDPTGEGYLYRWTAEQVAGVMNNLAGGEDDTFLTLADGERLSRLAGGANGIVADEAGHVFLTFNSMDPLRPSSLCMWNGIAGDDFNYDVLATAGSSANWFGPLAIDGDFLNGAPLYGSYGFGGPITEIAYLVPEPTTLALLGLGGLLLRRRK